jgi:hypothetical protein
MINKMFHADPKSASRQTQTAVRSIFQGQNTQFATANFTGPRLAV